MFAIAFAVEFCLTTYSGGLHVEFEQKYMRSHLIACLEKGEFSAFPKSKISKKCKIKTKNSVIESNCECGEADSVEDMVGCDWKKGVKTCNIWEHISCTGVNQGHVGDWYCSKHNN